MKIKLYKYISSCGEALVYDTDNYPNYYRNDTDYEYIGEWDLPDDFIEKCLPVFYVE